MAALSKWVESGVVQQGRAPEVREAGGGRTRKAEGPGLDTESLSNLGDAQRYQAEGSRICTRGTAPPPPPPVHPDGRFREDQHRQHLLLGPH